MSQLGTYEERPGIERTGLFYFKQCNAQDGFEAELKGMEQGNGILFFDNQCSESLLKYVPKDNS